MNLVQDDDELLAAGALLTDIGVPSPPKVILELSRMVMEPNPDYRTIAGLVNQDAALSAKVIKIINSPLFGLRKKVKSINHALTMLGMDYFKKVVIQSSLREVFAGGKDAHRYEKLWENNVAVSNMCKKVAEYWPKAGISSDLAYMVGLFHDCGAALMMRKFADYDQFYSDDWPPNAAHLLDREFERYQTNHCAVGCLVARSWGLSSDMCLAIRHHHREFPEQEGVSDARCLWAILRLAQFVTGYVNHVHDGGTHRDYAFEGMSLEDLVESSLFQKLSVSLSEVLSFINEVMEQPAPPVIRG
ncbi:MAG: HDOD domain-containing protein [Magnetococcales bacterium]|nr:HDOD domain-containing protein [Magnetococcales bacterium]NGZ26367.1 HDOD domain-containing protein [Magnetococcales bacterium]